MIFAPDASLLLLPEETLPAPPYQALLSAFQAARFEPQTCERLCAERTAGLPEGLLRRGAIANDELLFADPVYFPTPGAGMQLHVARPRRRALSLVLGSSDAESVGAMIRYGARTRDRDAFRDYAADLGEPLLSDLLGDGRCSPPAWPEVSRPGVYRREHASLLIRSRTTSLLVDPLVLCRDLPNLEVAPTDVAPDVDAVLISHSHSDHFHIPSILASTPSPSSPVIVPRVPRINLLTPFDLAASLRTVGQTAVELGWHESMRVGDIDVQALPFYGEQPTRLGPGAEPGLRSWGNCYRITTPDLSVLLLVDSGEDPEGSMVNVAERSFRERGPVDIVSACSRTFDSPFFGGLATYWATLRFSRLRALFRELEAGTLPTTTAGPRGIAQVCASVRARAFLPYANGFEKVGGAIRDIGWGMGEPSEREASDRVAGELARLGASTSVLSWVPGDLATVEGGHVHIRSAHV